MSTAHEAIQDRNQPRQYEIRIKGHLDDKWIGWFEGLIITRVDNGETLLCGYVSDQAALHGILRKIRDLGLPLLSVNTAPPEHMNRLDTDVDTNHKNKEAKL